MILSNKIKPSILPGFMELLPEKQVIFDDMVKKIIALLKDDNKLKKLSLKGYSSCQRYLLNNVANDWLNLLNGGKK